MMNRKVLSTMAAVTLLALTPAMASAETVSLAYPDGSLHLRRGPGTHYAAVGYLHDGDYIDVLSNGGQWSQVRTALGKTGYIRSRYIEAGDCSSGTKYLAEPYAAHATANVNFRTGASTGAAIIGSIAKGSKVTVLGENGDFYLLKSAQGRQGFAHKRYIARDKASTVKTVTARAVNMRRGGGLSYEVIKLLGRGTQVDVIGQGKYWTKVRHQGDIGWIKSVYLK